METKYCVLPERVEVLFKSYYVVWKPVWLEKHTVRKQCLNRTMQYGNAPLRHPMYLTTWGFKSYYVVWKLANLGRIIPIFSSLNRTMQYGNDIFPGQEAEGGSCLNRTMQYGNGLELYLKHIIFLSLNRTMQYGNKLVGQTFFREIFV